MSSVAFRFMMSLASPLLTLKETVQKYLEKREIKEQLASSLQAEIKEYEKINDELIVFGNKLFPIIQNEGQPSPRQLIEVIDCLSQLIKIFTKIIILFIRLAKACKDISKQEGFMSSLQKTNRFMYDFIERMGDTYIGKNTVKIDSSFFRFLLMYKKKIMKNVKIGKLDKDEVAFLQKRMKFILRGLNQSFLKRNVRRVAMKKWTRSTTQFNKVFKGVTIDAEGTDTAVLNDFIPSELRHLAPLLDKSP